MDRARHAAGGGEPPNQYLPGSGLGNEAWRDSCNSNIALRLGRITIEVVMSTEDVTEGSTADSRRTAAIGAQGREAHAQAALPAVVLPRHLTPSA